MTPETNDASTADFDMAETLLVQAMRDMRSLNAERWFLLGVVATLLFGFGVIIAFEVWLCPSC